MSGSVSAAVPNKLFNAIDVFIFCFLCCVMICLGLNVLGRFGHLRSAAACALRALCRY